MAAPHNDSSTVCPVAVSLPVEGHLTKIRLMIGPVFSFSVGVNINLIEAINDPRFVDVVGRHFHFNAVADGESDKAFAHFT